jgi:hypothetical protein
MRNNLKKTVGLPLLLICISVIVGTQAKAQYKARLSVEYHKIMGEKSLIKVGVKFKGDNGYEPATMLPLQVYREIEEDSLVLVGQMTTNMKGSAQYDLIEESDVDSIITHTYVVKIENSDMFKDADESVSFIDIDLKAIAIEKDSVYHISARLTDAKGNPIKDEKLKVMVHRLFAPLTIGKSSYKTEDDGTILVPIEEPLPGLDGKLTFEVMLDSKDYGIVSHIFEAPIGVPIIDRSTFDQRTMWSPPNKTPLFLWIFPNLIILGIWITIVILISNMVKIYNS